MSFGQTGKDNRRKRKKVKLLHISLCVCAILFPFYLSLGWVHPFNIYSSLILFSLCLEDSIPIQSESFYDLLYLDEAKGKERGWRHERSQRNYPSLLLSWCDLYFHLFFSFHSFSSFLPISSSSPDKNSLQTHRKIDMIANNTRRIHRHTTGWGDEKQVMEVLEEKEKKTFVSVFLVFHLESSLSVFPLRFLLLRFVSLSSSYTRHDLKRMTDPLILSFTSFPRVCQDHQVWCCYHYWEGRGGAGERRRGRRARSRKKYSCRKFHVVVAVVYIVLNWGSNKSKMPSMDEDHLRICLTQSDPLYKSDVCRIDNDNAFKSKNTSKNKTVLSIAEREIETKNWREDYRCCYENMLLHTLCYS